jgi:hypothetical protein
VPHLIFALTRACICCRPSNATRDKATIAALKGHAGRLNNWTAGANNVGATVFLMGASNAVRKTPLWRHFLYINDYFTKTGSGQT